MLVFSPKPYGQAALWPTYVASGNPQETRTIATEQAWEQAGLVTIPPIGLAPTSLPPYYSVRAANEVAERVGMGDAGQAIQVGAGAASTAISLPAVQAALGISSAAAGFATLGIGAAAMGVVMWLRRMGPKQKVASTKIVDEAEPILRQNRDMFLAGEKTDESKEYALAVFNQVWASVVASCSNASLGNPGKACVADRQRGGKWDWFSYYYDPIANTPTKPAANVAIDSAAASVGGVLAPVLGPNWDALLGFGLVGIGIISLMFGNGGNRNYRS